MPISFAVAPINWTNDDDPTLGGDISLEQCLTEMSEAGFTGCEIGNKFPKDIHVLLSTTKQFDLAITSDWIGHEFTKNLFDSELKKFKERLPFLKQAGVKSLKVCEVGHSIQQSSEPIFDNKIIFSDQQWQKLFAGLTAMGELAREHDMFVAYHHHLGTGVQDEEEIDHLMSNTHESLVSLLPDSGHLYVAGMDPYVIFDRYIDRIRYVHLKDIRQDVFTRAQDEHLSFMDSVRAGLFTVPGDGCIDFVPIFKLLQNNNYDGWLVIEAEQDPIKANPLIYAKKSRAYLQSYFGF